MEANRKNALEGGVKTPEGKAIARYNALKHGLLAKEVVVTVGEGAEDPAEFAALSQELASRFQPQGTVEEMLVEKIAVAYWRKDKNDLSKMHKEGIPLEGIYEWEENWELLPEKVNDLLPEDLDDEDDFGPKELRECLNKDANLSDDDILVTTPCRLGGVRWCFPPFARVSLLRRKI